MIEIQPNPSIRATLGPDRMQGLRRLIADSERADRDCFYDLSVQGIDKAGFEALAHRGRLRIAASVIFDSLKLGQLNLGRGVRIDYLFEDINETGPIGFIIARSGNPEVVDTHIETAEELIRGMYPRDPEAQVPVLSRDGQKILRALQERKGVLLEPGQNSKVAVYR